MKTFFRRSPCQLALILVMLHCGVLSAQTLVTTNRSDATWRVLRASVATTTNWVSDLTYDDSDAAGWTNAVQGSGFNIWHTSTQSSQSPANVRFRKKFFYSANPVIGASLRINFDDNGEAWFNGTQLMNDTGGGATTVVVPVDPALFLPGDNLVAVFGKNGIAPFNSINVLLIVTQLSLTITCPSNVVAWIPEGQSGALVPFNVSAAGEPPPVVTCWFNSNVITSPFEFPPGTNLVECVASNGVLADVYCSFLVTVNTGPADLYRLTIENATNSQLLRFVGVPGDRYFLQHTTNIESSWSNFLGPVTTDFSGILLTNVFQSATQAAGFFRYTQ
jgi:hypothetical protein